MRVYVNNSVGDRDQSTQSRCVARGGVHDNASFAGCFVQAVASTSA